VSEDNDRCWALTLVWNKGTRLHVQELFWTLEAANAAARLHAATMPNVHTATLMQVCVCVCVCVCMSLCVWVWISVLVCTHVPALC
jgi:hypothetical protein